MWRRVQRWWRLHWNRPIAFPCPYCGNTVGVYRRVLPYDAVIDHWVCDVCQAAGWGDKDTWYCGG